MVKAARHMLSGDDWYAARLAAGHTEWTTVPGGGSPRRLLPALSVEECLPIEEAVGVDDRTQTDAFDDAVASIRREHVREALKNLPARERRILELRFGFSGEDLSYEEIGHELDLTRERVKNLQDQALCRLLRRDVDFLEERPVRPRLRAFLTSRWGADLR